MKTPKEFREESGFRNLQYVDFKIIDILMKSYAEHYHASQTEMPCERCKKLENMLEDVVNELDLSESMCEEHGPRGTAPAELVRLVLEQKDKQIIMLKTGMVQIPPKRR